MYHAGWPVDSCVNGLQVPHLCQRKNKTGTFVCTTAKSRDNTALKRPARHPGLPRLVVRSSATRTLVLAFEFQAGCQQPLGIMLAAAAATEYIASRADASAAALRVLHGHLGNAEALREDVWALLLSLLRAPQVAFERGIT
jgi:hypothetical protein